MVSLRLRVRAAASLKPVSQDIAAAAADQPDEVIEVGRRGVVRVGLQIVHLRRARRHGGIADRIDFVGLTHPVSSRFLFLLLRNKPSSPVKVKRPNRFGPRYWNLLGRAGGADAMNCRGRTSVCARLTAAIGAV
jgi:hypothetical protein